MSKRIFLFEKIIIGYCWFMAAIILLFARPFSEYTDELIFYLSVSVLTLLITHYVDIDKNRLNKAIRYFYPAIMFSFFYRMTGGQMFLLFDSFYDWQLTAFEYALFGMNPTLYIDTNLFNVWLNEIISFCYFSYYFMIPVFMISVFVKKDYDILASFLSSTCVMFFCSYMLFFLYPIEGPRWHFAGQFINTIDGLFFRQAVEYVITNGAVRGGCMPSSHFGVALVIWMYCFRYYRKAAYIILPIVVGLGVGTIWGRFHYISDVFIGGLIGYIGTIIIWKYEKNMVNSTYKKV